MSQKEAVAREEVVRRVVERAAKGMAVLEGMARVLDQPARVLDQPAKVLKQPARGRVVTLRRQRPGTMQERRRPVKLEHRVFLTLYPRERLSPPAAFLDRTYYLWRFLTL